MKKDKVSCVMLLLLALLVPGLPAEELLGFRNDPALTKRIREKVGEKRARKPAEEPSAPVLLEPADAGMGAPYLDIRVQTGSTPFQNIPLTEELYRKQLNPLWKPRIDLLLYDEDIQELARRTAETGRPRPIQVALALPLPGEKRNRHDNGLVVFSPGSTERWDGGDRFKEIALHEIAHHYQWRAYAGWTPGSGHRGDRHAVPQHSLEVHTNRAMAWSEGFAAAVAYRIEEDPRLEDFRNRGGILRNRRRQRSTHELLEVEGYSAAVLHDFWMGTGGDERFERTMEVLLAESAAGHHPDLKAYLQEHIDTHPGDTLRLVLATAANSLIGDTLGLTAPDAVRQEARSLVAGLRRIAAAHGEVSTALATWEFLERSGEVRTAAAALRTVEAGAARLASGGEPQLVDWAANIRASQ